MKTLLKKALLLSIFTTAMLISSVMYSNSIAMENPRIKFNKIAHDFGRIEEGAELTYVYKFKNAGSGKLIIESVNASCGCTGATIGDKKEYGKNEEGEIKVTFKTRGREGLQSKTVTVQTNDPENPQIVLSFTCEIIKSK